MSFRNVISKSELLRRKRELQATKDVDKILSTKKDVIIQRISEVGPQVTKSVSKMLDDLGEAYYAFSLVALEYSEPELEHLSRLMEGTLELDLKRERYMDVHYWVPVKVSQRIPTPNSWALMELFEKGSELVSSLIEASWQKSFVLKLIKDLRDTDRLINALEKVVIPESEERIRTISLILEERDREELNRIKKVRDKLVRSGGRV